jgi:peptidase YpeB-like protein
MRDRVKNLLLIVLSVTALALGGSAIAGAASGSGGSSSSKGTPSAQPQAPARLPPNQAGLPPQRPDETLLTGDTAAKVRAAALAKVSGGTIERVETDADGHAAYEAHMTRSDGSRVTVYVDRSFEVVGVESGP